MLLSKFKAIKIKATLALKSRESLSLQILHLLDLSRDRPTLPGKEKEGFSSHSWSTHTHNIPINIKTHRFSMTYLFDSMNIDIG